MSAAWAVGLPALITRAADRFTLTDEATLVSSALGLWLLLTRSAAPSVPRSTTPTSWLERSTDGGRHWVTVAQYNDGGAGFVDLGFTTATQGVVIHGKSETGTTQPGQIDELLLTHAAAAPGTTSPSPPDKSVRRRTTNDHWKFNADMTSAEDWISALPSELAAQRALLHRLLAAVSADQQWDWLELGCSVAEGRGDALSDLDVALGYATADPPPVEVVTALVEGLGPVVEVSAQPFEGLPRWWVQYQDGTQLDLVVVSADYRSGRAPGSVALLDRTGRLTDTFTPSLWSAAADDPRNWMLDGWEALANVAKYLHRQSVLEALEQLSRARGRVLQLWAVAEQVPYPAFGLVSLLDNPGALLPPAIEATYARASADDVRTAALTTAALLGMAADRAQPGLATALGPYVIRRLHGPR